MTKNLVLDVNKLIKSFVYINCGSRGENDHPISDYLNSFIYIGFDADPQEQKKIKKSLPFNHYFFPVAVGEEKKGRKFYLTQNRACSSLLKPNQKMLNSFPDLKNQCTIEKTIEISTHSLDLYLPSKSIEDIDFLKLDTQGSELEILLNAKKMLNHCVGIKIETEFIPIYTNQPLFSEIDNFLRQFGFQIFSLQTVNYRRNNLSTKGQPLYANVIYLKDYSGIKDNLQKLLKLAFLSSYLGFHDYTFEILKTFNLKDKNIASLKLDYLKKINSKSIYEKILTKIYQSPGKTIISPMINTMKQIIKLEKNIDRLNRFNWKD